MNNSYYEKRAMLIRTIANTTVLAGMGLVAWIILIGADRILGLLGV